MCTYFMYLGTPKYLHKMSINVVHSTVLLSRQFVLDIFLLLLPVHCHLARLYNPAIKKNPETRRPFRSELAQSLQIIF